MDSRTAVLFLCLTATGYAAGDAAKGKTVFQQCSMCHSATTAQAKAGPSLKGLFKKEKLTSGQKPSEQVVRAKIDQGGASMPKYKDVLTAKEKDDLIAYLKTI